MGPPCQKNRPSRRNRSIRYVIQIFTSRSKGSLSVRNSIPSSSLSQVGNPPPLHSPHMYGPIRSVTCTESNSDSTFSYFSTHKKTSEKQKKCFYFLDVIWGELIFLQTCQIGVQLSICRVQHTYSLLL